MSDALLLFSSDHRRPLSSEGALTKPVWPAENIAAAFKSWANPTGFIVKNKPGSCRQWLSEVGQTQLSLVWKG